MRLIDYINEAKSRRLLVFDVDDTILKCGEQIDVVKDGVVVRRLNTSALSDYVLKSGETLDFSSFGKTLGKSRLLPLFDTMKREFRRGTDIAIVSARSDKALIQDFLYSNGVDLPTENIVAVHDKSSGLSGTTAERKKRTIERLVRRGYDVLVFFDDSDANLEAAKELGRELGVRVITKNPNR